MVSDHGHPTAPDGWHVRRQRERQWYLYHGERWVSELGVLTTGEWWVCPDGEVLPWGRTFTTSTEAIDAVVRWWRFTRR